MRPFLFKREVAMDSGSTTIQWGSLISAAGDDNDDEEEEEHEDRTLVSLGVVIGRAAPAAAGKALVLAVP
jgi:hypothetical protein